MDFERESFFYKDFHLCAKTAEGDKNLLDLINDQEGPIYLYNKKTILKRIAAYKEAFSGFKNHIHFAVKSNSHPEILKIFKKEGLGADVVSIGEFNRAIESGFRGEDIIFSGVAKTHKEIKESIEKNVFQINCESLSEIKRVAKVAEEVKKIAKIGIRINPDIPVNTHPYIATGFRENKFGIPLKQITEVSKIVKDAKFLELQGISCHIGSQIMEVDPLIKAFESILIVYKELMAIGHEIEFLDLGGGLGVDYHSNDENKDIENIKEFGRRITDLNKNFEGTLLFEPGRSLIARSGILLARVEYIKSNGFKNFIVVNSGMNHLLRPSLYKAYHKILPLKLRDGKAKAFDVVGPICESSDVLGYDRTLVEPQEGDWLAILDAGAYGMSMASAYNHHPFPIEIII